MLRARRKADISSHRRVWSQALARSKGLPLDLFDS
jgi:hypothetical protein